jgi:hypothetical protein
MRVSNFLQGNIIFEFRVYTAHQCTPELFHKADNAATLFDREYAIKQLQEMRRDHCVLLELVPTYGCELAAIACCPIEDIQLVPGFKAK